LIISTDAGLWRDMIGDTVQFTSLDPFHIVVSGRTRHYINVFGEELIVDNAEKALALACEKTRSRVTDFTAAPVFMEGNESGAHEYLIEFDKEPADLDEFIATFDDSLKAINSDYEAKRYKDKILRKPIVHVVPKGTFYNWMKSRNQLGGQNK